MKAAKFIYALLSLATYPNLATCQDVCVGAYVAIGLGLLLAIVSTVLAMFVLLVFCKQFSCIRRYRNNSEGEDQSDASPPYFSTRGAEQQQPVELGVMKQNPSYGCVGEHSGMRADAGIPPAPIHQSEASYAEMPPGFLNEGNNDSSGVYSLAARRISAPLKHAEMKLTPLNHKHQTNSDSEKPNPSRPVVYEHVESTYDETPEDIAFAIKARQISRQKEYEVSGHSSYSQVETKNLIDDTHGTHIDPRGPAPNQEESLYDVAEATNAEFNQTYSLVRK